MRELKEPIFELWVLDRGLTQCSNVSSPIIKAFGIFLKVGSELKNEDILARKCKCFNFVCTLNELSFLRIKTINSEYLEVVPNELLVLPPLAISIQFFQFVLALFH